MGTEKGFMPGEEEIGLPEAERPAVQQAAAKKAAQAVKPKAAVKAKAPKVAKAKGAKPKAAVKAKAPKVAKAKGEKKAAKPKVAGNGFREESLSGKVWADVQKKEQFSYGDITKAFEKHGSEPQQARNNASGLVTRLKKLGLVKKISRGVFAGQ